MYASGIGTLPTSGGGGWGLACSRNVASYQLLMYVARTLFLQWQGKYWGGGGAIAFLAPMAPTPMYIQYVCDGVPHQPGLNGPQQIQFTLL